MVLIRKLITVAALLLLAGCFRQANDEFQTVNSQSDSPPVQIATEIPTQPLILNPNETVDSTTIPAALSTDETLLPLPLLEESPTPTIIIIQPVASVPPNTPRPPSVTPPSAPTLLPTATPPQIITPEPGNPAQLVIPSAVPGSATPVGVPGLPPTPTDLADLPTGECAYTVVAGDNLFRIAVGNGVSLSDLLLANDLTENSIIQPGQVLQIPGCIAVDDDGATAPSATASNPTTGVATALPPGVTTHTVASGETLGAIARRYGVSIQALIDANNLTNPDRLAIGQQLIIPSQQ